ncbi:4-(cytidine 5'-diphospho)-2-C-methyl-D-erythritol kinase [Helicobacter valdiviensis]|uniref:4-(cytidine 5'-diphospho)-2-C-methyl-D-erythritol kinase n=1 Tax=Helicobacter valdiviensis TaxID=1458358 RepID=A0A2W6NK96_9HELI|nr:4-(cytidine 5'-diphospho)-2-C-methyl-D-erythritol kinase [Helicobacter valdiviensis]PZT47816.1 4-(cytidine 5'-diphospho)-2-C-methyl-D-erythritol kinase [Helicobacter valdiviensis]
MKTYAKINIFLKITGKMQEDSISYHTLVSRFMRVGNLYDVLEFQEGHSNFEVCGNFDCKMEQNTIYKSYLALLEVCTKEQKEFLNALKVEVEKNIPTGSGLGGGSSNAAGFILWVNQKLGLNLTKEELYKIGAKVGSDVPFFLSEEEIANVEGRGEIIKNTQERTFKVEIITPKIHANTKEIYKLYAKKFYAPISTNEAKSWLDISNQDVFKKDAISLNDLLLPLLEIYPSLKEYLKEGYFLSGSGSSFWRVK